MTRDANRARVYEAEGLALRLMERAGGAHTVQIAGTELTVPAEARFGSLEAVRAYTDDVLALRAVRDRFSRAEQPVRFRRRRGDRAAHYERAAAVIALPDSAGGTWALRELVVLHEIAHHLDDRVPDGNGDESPVHGPQFVQALIDLVGLVMGPEVGLLYRVVFTDAGAC